MYKIYNPIEYERDFQIWALNKAIYEPNKVKDIKTKTILYGGCYMTHVESITLKEAE